MRNIPIVKLSLILVAAVCISLLLEQWFLSRKQATSIHKLHFTYNNLLAQQQQLYPVCSKIPSLLTKVNDYKSKYPNIYKSQLEGKVWCGKVRSGWFDRKTTPWPGCESQLPNAKKDLLTFINDLCEYQKQANDILAARMSGHSITDMHTIEPTILRIRPYKRGIVYTGSQKHFKQMYISLLSLIRVKNTFPVEIFTDIDKLELCKLQLASQFHNTTCHTLPKNIAGFAAKFYSTAMSSFSESLFIDADTILMRNPLELFESKEFKEYGSVWWPDLWGEECRLQAKPNEMVFGETAFSTHMLYTTEIMDLQWSNIRNVSHETETFLFVLDLNRHLPLLDLSIFIVEHELWHRQFYGDKDVMRLGHFFMGLPFYQQPHVPASAVLLPSFYRDSLVHFAGDDPTPFILHQLKSKNPSAFEHIYRLKETYRDEPSFCIHSYLVGNETMFEEMTIKKDFYDPKATVAVVAEIYAAAEKYWASIKK